MNIANTQILITEENRIGILILAYRHAEKRFGKKFQDKDEISFEEAEAAINSCPYIETIYCKKINIDLGIGENLYLGPYALANQTSQYEAKVNASIILSRNILGILRMEDGVSQTFNEVVRDNVYEFKK